MNIMSTRNKNILEKKIPRNPKYKDIKHVVDTGASYSKYMAKIEDIRQNYRHRPDEIFKRMKLSTFVQLLIQVAEITSREEQIQIEERVIRNQEAGDATSRPDTAIADAEVLIIEQNGTNSPAPSLAVTEGDFGAPLETSRSTLNSVIHGIGEIDSEKTDTVDGNSPIVTKTFETCPYLLLDVREKEDYDMCHIITSENYPSAMLSRSVNYETKELLTYKNQPGKIILLYDEDERIAHKSCTTMVQRGYDNLFLLSGGLKVGFKTFPDGLITGTVPGSISPLKKGQVPHYANQKHFSDEDLMNLNNSLDNFLLSSSSASSRFGRSTAASRVGAASKLSTKSTVSSYKDSKPIFKP